MYDKQHTGKGQQNQKQPSIPIRRLGNHHPEAHQETAESDGRKKNLLQRQNERRNTANEWFAGDKSDRRSSPASIAAMETDIHHVVGMRGIDDLIPDFRRVWNTIQRFQRRRLRNLGGSLRLNRTDDAG